MRLVIQPIRSAQVKDPVDLCYNLSESSALPAAVSRPPAAIFAVRVPHPGWKVTFSYPALMDLDLPKGGFLKLEEGKATVGLFP